MNINLNVDTHDIVEGLRISSYEEIIVFIKMIDCRIADAGFTEQLAKWALNEAVREFKFDNDAAGVEAYVLGLLDE